MRLVPIKATPVTFACVTAQADAQSSTITHSLEVFLVIKGTRAEEYRFHLGFLSDSVLPTASTRVS